MSSWKTVKMRDGKKLTNIPNKKHFAINVEKNGDERLQKECFAKIGKVDRKWQRRIEWRTSVEVQICSASQQQKNGHPKHNTIVVYEVEESDNFGDETVAETF